jgi:hypothetical protein
VVEEVPTLEDDTPAEDVEMEDGSGPVVDAISAAVDEVDVVPAATPPVVLNRVEAAAEEAVKESQDVPVESAVAIEVDSTAKDAITAPAGAAAQFAPVSSTPTAKDAAAVTLSAPASVPTSRTPSGTLTMPAALQEMTPKDVRKKLNGYKIMAVLALNLELIK